MIKSPVGKFRERAHGKHFGLFLFERQNNWDRKRHKFPNYWLIPQMVAIAHARPGQSNVFSSRSPRWVAGNLMTWGIFGCFPIPLAGSWIRRGIARTQTHTQMGSWHHRLHLICLNACPPDLLCILIRP